MGRGSSSHVLPQHWNTCICCNHHHYHLCVKSFSMLPWVGYSRWLFIMYFDLVPVLFPSEKLANYLEQLNCMPHVAFLFLQHHWYLDFCSFQSSFRFPSFLTDQTTFRTFVVLIKMIWRLDFSGHEILAG